MVDVPEIHTYAINMSSSQEITCGRERYASSNSCRSENIDEATRWNVERSDDRI
jgi:hypothetical protein